MTDAAFADHLSISKRIAAVRATAAATHHRLPLDSRRDLEQEALLELWLKRRRYDPRRGGWRTFSEQVVANRISSLVRCMHSERSGQFREASLDCLTKSAAPLDRRDLCLGVFQVLARTSLFDRSVALRLVDHSAIETSQQLGVSRATVYRAIGRLRAAFTEAGIESGTA